MKISKRNFNQTKLLYSFFLGISLLLVVNLVYASAFNFKAEHSAQYEYLRNCYYFSAPICGLGTLLCIICLILNHRQSQHFARALNYLSFMIIAIGTLSSGAITYTGEDSPSFVVVFLVTLALIPVSLFFIIKFGRSCFLSCFLLLYSPSLAYYSAQQWVIWNTKLFGDQIAKIEGWNFEVNAWKWFNLEEVEKEDVIVYNWTPLFRRFAIKESGEDYYGKGKNADILYSVENVNGKLLITNATRVLWNSSGETGVWPSR